MNNACRFLMLGLVSLRGAWAAHAPGRHSPITYFAISKWKILLHCLRTLALSVLLCAVRAHGQVEYDPGWQRVTDWNAWIDQDARAILTSLERAKFLALKTDKDRQQSARKVWLDTNIGPHYERLAYADKNFAFGAVKGSQTDRGLVYIRFGPPDSVTPNERSESWSYKSGLGATFRKTETGEYRIEAMGGGGRVLEMNPHGSLRAETPGAPQPEPINEFSGGPPPKECRCDGFQRSPGTQIKTKHKPYIETSFFPLTDAATRVILLMADKQLWFHNKPNTVGHILSFRGRVLSPNGREIVKFHDLWLPRNSPDTTWPLNRCERIYLSPGKYRIEITAEDWSNNASPLAHCDASLKVPGPNNHPAERLPHGPYSCH